MCLPPAHCSYSDISYIRIWAGLAVNLGLTTGTSSTGGSNSGFLTVWLSTSTNFTTTGIKCAQGVNIITNQDGIVTCPQSTTAYSFVTVQRIDPKGLSDNLVIHELHVIRACEWHMP